MLPACILIADSRYEAFPRVAAQMAMLRGLVCWRLDLAQGRLPDIRSGRSVLFAMSYSTLRSLKPADARRLRAQVENGNKLYVRGGFKDGQRCPFAPFGPGHFEVLAKQHTAGYSFTDHHLVPAVLRNERVIADMALPVALGTDRSADVLTAAHQPAAPKLPITFAVDCGSGSVIYDLLPDEVPVSPDTAVVDRLSDAASRCWDTGALIAVNHAQGRPSEKVPAYNLTLDDRPRNRDHFSTTRTRKWLEHIDSSCPGAHVDFAWTPIDNHPNTGYVRTVRRYNTGFAWHGLWQHCDHREVKDFAADFAKGETLVRAICRRYGVTFQPVMVFPYLHVSLESVKFVAQAGFAGAVRESEPALQTLPSFMVRSTPFDDLYDNRFPAVRRLEPNLLTRGVMLANAALDLPVITCAHPVQVGLQRWSALYNPRYRPSVPFEHVLTFAREKRLVAMSLEEICAQALTRPCPVTTITDYQDHIAELGVAV
jgi:hypothetical protein